VHRCHESRYEPAARRRAGERIRRDAEPAGVVVGVTGPQQFFLEQLSAHGGTLAPPAYFSDGGGSFRFSTRDG
jgi:hypothetical protein